MCARPVRGARTTAHVRAALCARRAPSQATSTPAWAHVAGDSSEHACAIPARHLDSRGQSVGVHSDRTVRCRFMYSLAYSEASGLNPHSSETDNATAVTSYCSDAGGPIIRPAVTGGWLCQPPRRRVGRRAAVRGRAPRPDGTGLAGFGPAAAGRARVGRRRRRTPGRAAGPARRRAAATAAGGGARARHAGRPRSAGARR